jgi:hypothetical protein
VQPKLSTNLYQQSAAQGGRQDTCVENSSKGITALKIERNPEFTNLQSSKNLPTAQSLELISISRWQHLTEKSATDSDNLSAGCHLSKRDSEGVKART